jgi:pyruvate-ferredoxin/flavodoxin oxidoreductase
VEVCPAKNKSEAAARRSTWTPKLSPLRARAGNYDFFLDLPESDRRERQADSVKGSQFLRAAVRVLRRLRRLRRDALRQAAHQLFGDRMQIANATGCSSIYGGNLPTTPWARRRRARPGLVQLAVRGQRRVRPSACAWPSTSRPSWPANCSRSSPQNRRRPGPRLDADQTTESELAAQRERVAEP